MKTTSTYSRHISTNYLQIGTLLLIALIIIALAFAGCNPLTIVTVFGLLAATCVAAYFSGSLISTRTSNSRKQYSSETIDKFPWCDDSSEKAVLTQVNNSDNSNLSSDEDKSTVDGMELLRQDITAEFDSKCEVNNEQLTYTYQGGFFQVQSIDSNVVRLYFPKLYTATVLQQDMICRSINRINSSYAVCKLVASADTQNMSIDIHGFADFPYTGQHDKRVKLLKDVMAVFFDMQRSLIISMAVSETLQQEYGAPEPDEFSTSYKDISLN